MLIENNRFLVIGGFGLVASHIIRQLLEANAAEVVVMDNGAVGNASGMDDLLGNERIRFIQGDVLRMEDLMSACKGVQGVFYTAAFITIPLSKRPVLGMDVNVKGFINALEACRWQGVKKILYASSIAAFGNQKSGVIDETGSYNGHGVAPASALYGIAKLMAEQMCALYCQYYGLEWVSLRLSTVYGERQHARGVNVLPIVEAREKVRNRQPLEFAYDPQEVHDYVYVGDVARAHLLAMQGDVTGEIITIATGKPTSIETLVRHVLDACACKDKPEFVSDANRLKSAGATINSFNIDKASRLLGWSPQVNIETGVKRLVQWLDAH